MIKWWLKSCKSCKGSGRLGYDTSCVACKGIGSQGIIARIKRWWKLPTPFALPMKCLAPAEEYAWEDWDREMRQEYPRRFFFQEIFPMWFRVNISMRISDLLYWFRSHTYRRYHLLDLRNSKQGYKWGYCDPSEKILYACFKILCDFVENDMKYVCYYAEATKQTPEWNKREEEKEILELYKWWTESRPQEIEDVNYFYPFEGPCKDDVMLERLMKIRNYLWT